MIDFQTLLTLNERDVLSVGIDNNPHGIFALEYADARPLFYADGTMIPKSDRPAYRTAITRITSGAILHGMVENGRYNWQFSDLSGVARGNVPGDETGPRDELNMPTISRIPMPEPGNPDEDVLAFDAAAMPTEATYHNVNNTLWAHHHGFVFQFPLVANRIQSRHAEFELFLMDGPKLTMRGFSYLTDYVWKMRHIDYMSRNPQTRLDRYDAQLNTLARLFYGTMGR